MRHRIGIIGAVLFVSLQAAIVMAAKSSADVTAALNTSALRQGQPALLAVVVDVHAGLHAQSHTPSDESFIKFEVTPDAASNVQFGDPAYPPGVVETYPLLGKLNVYTGRVIVYVPIRVPAGTSPGALQITGHVKFQACNASSCFAPENPAFTVATTIVASDAAVTPQNAELFATAPPALLNEASWSVGSTAAAMIPPPDNSATNVSLFGHSFNLRTVPLPVAICVAFLAGIIFNIVPCVLPVLPLKAIGFYEVSQHNRARCLLLGFVFSCGLVAVFAALGLIILLSKSIFGSQISWGQQFSHPWFVWVVAIVLTLLGLGMLGLFSFNLPTSVYGLDFRHDTLGGNFMWGALTAVLSTPCTAPLFPPVLAFSLLLPVVEGFLLVSMVGVGMASPYFVLSAFPELARRFPRTGPASELVKQMMGFLLLATAAYFAALELVGEPHDWWFVFAVVLAGCVYLVIRTPQVTKSRGALYVTTSLAVAVTAFALFVTLQLTDFFPPKSAHGGAIQEVQWQPYSAQALADARKQNKIIVIDFTAAWCPNCKYVEATVYRDGRTIDAIHKRDVLTLKADLTDSTAVGWPLLNELTNTGIPYTAIYLPGMDKPVGLASIYTTDTLLGVIDPQAVAAVK